jgi:hypothetical protein
MVDPRLLRWEQDHAEYRVQIWTQRKARPPSTTDQDRIGWSVHAYEVTDVDDVREAVEWAETQAREASEHEETNQAVYALYVFVPEGQPGAGAGLIQISGVNPTRAD